MTEATIGIISIDQDSSFFSERYFREILTAVSQEVVSHNCYVRIVSLLHEHASTHDTTQALAAQNIDAALLLAPSEAFLSDLQDIFQTLPSIIISALRLDVPFSYVNSDNYGALREVVAHLASLGRRRIKLILPFGEISGDFGERARGYEDAVEALGLERLSTILPYPIVQSWVDQQLLADAPDALIAPGDTEALALLSRLQRRSLRVPADIALVGFDDEDFASETFPALTTVSQPLDEMARRAVRYLLDRLAGIDRGLYQEVLPNRLIVRESCGAQRL